MRSKFLFYPALAACIWSAVACGNAPVQEKKSSVYENDVIEAIMERRSIRKYADRAVEKEKLEIIAECGVYAPNAMNAQKWEVRVVTDPAWINGMTELQLGTMDAEKADAMRKDPSFRNIFRNGTALFVVAVKPEGMTMIDAGLMGENMMLAAHSLGLGSCCLGSAAGFLKSPVAAEYLEQLDFKDGYEVQYIIAVGYPDEKPAKTKRNMSVIKYIEAE